MERSGTTGKTSFVISQLASEFEVSTRTIRFYEEKGLLSPERSDGNQRIYTKKERTRLKLILRGKRLGFSLDDIAEMIGMSESHMHEMEQLKKSLEFGEKKLLEIRRQQEELKLLESDILSLKKRIVCRIKELSSADP